MNLPGAPEPTHSIQPQEWPVAPPPTHFAEHEEAEQGGNPLGRYLAVLLRQKWIILLVTAIGTVLGAVASRLVDPVYTTQATLWVETEDAASVRSGPIQTGQLLQSTAWIELLRSYTVLDYVVTHQRLYIETDPASDRPALAGFELEERFRPGKYELTVDGAGREYRLRTGEGAEVERGNVGAPVGTPIGFNWTPTSDVLSPNRTLRFEIKNPRDVAVGLGQELGTSMTGEGGNFLRLSLAGTDPQQTAATLNALTQRYVDVAGELKRAKLVELTGILEEQRLYAEDNLRQAELELESFKVNTITLPSEGSAAIAPGLEITRDPVFSSFFELRVQNEQLRQDREAIVRVLGQLEDGSVSVEALSLIPAVSGSATLTQALGERTQKQAELRALLQQYTDQHRDVRVLSADLETLERVTIPRLAMGLVAEMEARQSQVETRIAGASADLRQIPTRSIEEARLERQVAIAENLHTTLKQRFEEARLAAASSIPDIRVLDEAVVPYEPTSNDSSMVLLMGFLGSLGLSVLGLILLDRFDPRVRYPEQVTHEIGLPILSAIPFVKRIGGKQDEQFAHAAESLRELRLSLLYAHGAAGPLTVTVTSPESGDGKSFIAANLALSFAEQGHRTLLIDGDIRKGRLHRLFGRNHTPGLTDYLARYAELSEIIQETDIANVFFVSTGTRMANGPELLSSSAMGELITKARARFGVIVVDSPPLGAGVDPYVLSTMTRDMLLVLRTGTTNRAYAEAKLELMSRLPVRVLGAVLNGTPPTQAYRYYSYLPGYRVEDEPVALQAETE